MPKKLIILMGPPATGKSTLANKISKAFQIPIISKDEGKELLFNTLGYNDREWSKKIGIASFEIMYLMLEKLLQANITCILETDFSAPNIAEEKLNALVKLYHLDTLIINLKCDGKILKERFYHRSKSGERHPGHQDHQSIDEFSKLLLTGKREKLKIPAQYYELDTTNFINQNIMDEVSEKISIFLN